MPFGTEKLDWHGYPMVFDAIHELDRHTQTLHDGIGRTYA